MISGLEKVDPVVPNEVDEAMFLGQAARPGSREQMFQGLRFPDAGEGLSKDRFEKAKKS